LDALLAVVLWYSNNNASRLDQDNETPLSIVKLAYNILNPKVNTVADLCSGIGTFLTFTALQNDKCSLYGMDINTQSKVISEIRLSLFTNKVEIEQGSVLDISKDKKFDRIFCNYPWNIRTKYLSSNNRQIIDINELIPETRKITTSDWYFILNVVEHLSDDGKAIVLTTNEITWNGGMNKKIRERFIKMGFLEAAIALPQNMFSHTLVSSSMLVLSKNDFESIRFIDASEFATVRRKNKFSDEAIQTIANMLKIDGKFSKQVSITEIANMDYAVNPSRYLQTEIKVKDGVPFGKIIKKLLEALKLEHLF